MNNKIRKFFTYLLLTVLTVVGLGNIANVSATGTDGEDPGPLTDVVITKVETNDEAIDMTLEQLANGVDVANYFTDGKVLPGVSFTYYSVTEDQLGILTANPESYDTVAEVDAFLEEAGAGKSTAETDEDGVVTIEDLPEGNYWIVENTKGTIVSSRAVPFALTLPFTNLKGDGWLGTINVYPKNTLADEPVDPVKTVNEPNVAIGDTNTWTISQEIPEGIEDYETFTFVDEIDSRLDWLGNVNVSAEGVTFVDDDYTVNYVAAPEGTDGTLINHTISGILTVVFTEQGRKNLANANGTVVITFDTKVNDSADMGEPINNNVELQFNNGHVTEDKNKPGTPTSVHTGGYKFQKLDGEAGLAGAEFIISREITDDEGETSTEYVQVVRDAADAITEVNFIANKDGATKFESADSTGLFEVRGLPYGHYTLTEVKAPEGYALPTNPDTPFEVTKDSYKDVQQTIQNKEITIPQTGGIGTMIFTVIGAALMVFATIYYKKTGNA